MPTPLLQNALLFFSLFALGSLVGVLCYWIMMRGDEMVQILFVVFSIVAANFLVLFVSFVAILAMLVTGLLCILPAFVEKSMDNNRLEWGAYFVRIAVATYLSLSVGMSVMIFGQSLIERLCVFITSSPVAGDISRLALAAGFVLTPPSISLLRWIWHTSKLRPGFDRHFSEEEQKQ